MKLCAGDIVPRNHKFSKAVLDVEGKILFFFLCLLVTIVIQAKEKPVFFKFSFQKK